MKNYVSKFAIFVALSCGFALAQSMPQQQSPQSAPTSPSASQPAPDQSTQPAAQPDQSAQPSSQSDQQAKPDEKKSDDQNSKMPQSDTPAAAGGDVQNQVQSAIQQDPKLSNSNITVSVNGKNLELNGTVQNGDDKKEAEKIAKSNAGSLKVKNHIKVASANAPASDKSSAPPKY